MTDQIQFVSWPADQSFATFFANLTQAIDKALALPEDFDHPEEQSFAE